MLGKYIFNDLGQNKEYSIIAENAVKFIFDNVYEIKNKKRKTAEIQVY